MTLTGLSQIHAGWVGWCPFCQPKAPSWGGPGVNGTRVLCKQGSGCSVALTVAGLVCWGLDALPVLVLQGGEFQERTGILKAAGSFPQSPPHPKHALPRLSCRWDIGAPFPVSPALTIPPTPTPEPSRAQRCPQGLSVQPDPRVGPARKTRPDAPRHNCPHSESPEA